MNDKNLSTSPSEAGASADVPHQHRLGVWRWNVITETVELQTWASKLQSAPPRRWSEVLDAAGIAALEAALAACSLAGADRLTLSCVLNTGEGALRCGLSGRFVARDAQGRPQLAVGYVLAAADAPPPPDATALIAEVSGNLRAPLDEVVHRLEAALESVEDVRQRRRLSAVRASSLTLLRAVDGMLAEVRQSSPTPSLPAVFDPRRVVRNVLDRGAPEACARNLDLCCYIDPVLPQELLGDAARLERVLLELVDNALRFTPGGEVALRVSVLTRDDDGVRVQFLVRDTGIGVDLAAGEQPFDGVGAGDAVGLPLCRRLVQEMGGRIGVQSIPGRGSTFYMLLGFAPVASEAVKPDAPAPRHRRVLVSSPHAGSAAVLAESLGDLGDDALIAHDAAETERLLHEAAVQSEPFDLWFLDAGLAAADDNAMLRRFAASPLSRCILVGDVLHHAATAPLAATFGIRARLCLPATDHDIAAAVAIACNDTVDGAQSSGPDFEIDIDAAGIDSALRWDSGEYRIALLVDIDAGRLAQRKLMLEQLGYAVVTAGSGAEAVDRFDYNEFDVILMDLAPPDMDGVAVAAAIRERQQRHSWVAPPRIPYTPIIGLVDAVAPGVERAALDAGIDRVLPRPANAEALAAILREVTTESWSETWM